MCNLGLHDVAAGSVLSGRIQTLVKSRKWQIIMGDQIVCLSSYTEPAAGIFVGTLPAGDRMAVPCCNGRRRDGSGRGSVACFGDILRKNRLTAECPRGAWRREGSASRHDGEPINQPCREHCALRTGNQGGSRFGWAARDDAATSALQWVEPTDTVKLTVLPRRAANASGSGAAHRRFHPKSECRHARLLKTPWRVGRSRP